ncbi:FGGY-family carbohydrate kinase [Pseudomonas corrugata]|uniref:xylulokinase n=1 Tax=Pseudomonas corrugata TaxID=47879 RepID=UPI0022301D0D|nr:FGGY-family carbohydrate kinase [Pseudomonas corrugata]UZD97731.1 FGGY-family carbohydrate kinase [Pseudomonas corrugata]
MTSLFFTRQPETAAGLEQLVLAVDLGTSGCKCALVSLEGEIRAWAFHSVALHVDGLSAEQEPQDWWDAFMRGAAELLGSDPARRRQVVAVSCSTQSEGTVCVDRNGVAIGRALLWLDKRGANAVKRRMGGGRFSLAGYAPLKLLHSLRLTGGVASLSGMDSAGHMAYVLDHEPQRYERTYKFLNVLDYMNLRLAGRFCATADSILTSWITDNRDPHRIRYDNGLVRALGVDADKLPELVNSTDVIGPLLPELADALGLSRDTQVVAGAVDTSAVAVGAAVNDFASHLYLGTSSWVGAHVPFKKTSVRHHIAAVPSAVGGRYLALAMQSAAGANLSFLRDKVLYHPDELLSDEQQPDVYALLDRIAARVPAGSRGLLYTPWLCGERSPVGDPSLRAGLLNMKLEHSREDIIRAFMEGVALNTRWMLEPFSRFLGQPKEVIVATGGGAQSDVWCQIMADVTGHVIEQPHNPIQTNARGAAFIAAVALGKLRFEDLPTLQRAHRTYEPSRQTRALYDDRFATFQEVRKRLAPLYRRLNPSQETVS